MAMGGPRELPSTSMSCGPARTVVDPRSSGSSSRNGCNTCKYVTVGPARTVVDPRSSGSRSRNRCNTYKYVTVGLALSLY